MTTRQDFTPVRRPFFVVIKEGVLERLPRCGLSEEDTQKVIAWVENREKLRVIGEQHLPGVPHSQRILLVMSEKGGGAMKMPVSAAVCTFC